jgi:hypothetical protein
MERDSQKSKVYRAEDRAFPGMYVEDGRTGLSLDEMQALVDRWKASKVLQRHYPRAKRALFVKDGRGKRHACCKGDRLEMPRFTRTKPHLLHEFAHAITPRQVKHGPEFAAAYLYVVRVFMSKSSEERLREEFKAAKVRWRPKRQVRISEADRQKARERMQALNARRRELATC